MTRLKFVHKKKKYDIANRDKLQAYIKQEPNINSDIFKTIEERFGPANFKFHQLDIKVKPTIKLLKYCKSKY